jgi:hypothetical protein
MLGYVAPLLVAMLHVVLERFSTGYLLARGWLTTAFALLVVAWPLRTLPPLFDPPSVPPRRPRWASRGCVTAALLFAAARNALAPCVPHEVAAGAVPIHKVLAVTREAMLRASQR